MSHSLASMIIDELYTRKRRKRRRRRRRRKRKRLGSVAASPLVLVTSLSLSPSLKPLLPPRSMRTHPRSRSHPQLPPSRTRPRKMLPRRPHLRPLPPSWTPSPLKHLRLPPSLLPLREARKVMIRARLINDTHDLSSFHHFMRVRASPLAHFPPMIYVSWSSFRLLVLCPLL